MFESHPVPQQISSYQFRLIGDMTIKQFSQLGGGALISLLIYATSFPGFIKWPLVIFFALSGAAFAFLPFEERPLDQWVVAFFRSIYSPTIFNWQPEAKTAYFQEEAVPQVTAPEAEAPAEQANINRNAFLANLEQTEKDFLSKFGSLFTLPFPKTKEVAVPAPEPAIKTQVAIPQNIAQNTVITIPTRREPVPLVPAKPIEVKSQQIGQTLVGQISQIPTVQAQFTPEAAPPSPPTQANIVVGQVTDVKGKIIEGAILEIKDTMSRPVRALRTNKVGHFMIVTPLANGKYRISVDKDGYTFNPIEIELVGNLVSPISLKGEEIKQ